MATKDDDDDIKYAEGWEEYGEFEGWGLEEELEEESILTVYDPDNFVSGAIVTEGSSLPADLFDFQHSYGYDCLKNWNLCACDETVVAWAAGSIITFFDINTKQIWFRRSTTGGSVGNICSYRKDPNYRIAIAEAKETDNDPVIILYLWPEMEIDAVLREGTENAYAILDFSPDGELLASIGKEPDFNITIWNWKRHKIMLRTQAFTYGVNTVMFSPYCPGQLTTSGLAHIKFWKMAQTFTGLKLKGELGRFGKTEICDVLGIYPMPDEKVLSGCAWGNILVWEAGLVKVEVTQRGRKRCHGKPIIQFMLSQDGYEVTTISQDGYIRAWYWDTVEQADPPEDDQYVELNPVAETYVPDCQIMCLKHQKDMYWYAQDGNGGIWVVDIELDKLSCNHQKKFTRHAGPVVNIICMRTHPILLTAGTDGAIMAFNTETKNLVARYMFTSPITCMMYAPIELDETSRILIVGFSDGMMRLLCVHADLIMEQTQMIEVRVTSVLTVHSEDDPTVNLIDMILWLKPHNKKINKITINTQRTLLVTASEDSTIFLYKVVKQKGEMPFTLERICFIETPNVIEYMTWKPGEERVLLLCGQVGYIMEAVLPDIQPREYSEITTFLLKFKSYSESLIKRQYMRSRPLPMEEDLASLDEEALKAAAESDKKKDEDDKPWMGEIQLIESDDALGTTITWAEYCDDGVWVTQKGTGAMLLIKPGSNKIHKYAPIPGAWCDDLSALKFICDRRYILVGTDNGYIRVLKMPTEEEDNPEYHYLRWLNDQKSLLKELKGRRLKKEENQPTPMLDLYDNYYIQMHDRDTGAILDFAFSEDGKYMYSAGADGNIFSFAINFDIPFFAIPELPEGVHIQKVPKVKEPSTLEGDIMSHEQLKQKEEYDKLMSIANAHKKRVRDQLAEITMEYAKLIKDNRLLPCSQQIDVTLDPRPLVIQEKELEEAMALTVRKLAHQLEASDLGLHKMYSRNIIQLDVYPFTLKAIRDPKVMIRPIRQKNLSKTFYDQLEEVYRKSAEAALRGRHHEAIGRRQTMKRPSMGAPKIASFLLGLPPDPPHPLKKQLRLYYRRLNRHHIQFLEWQEHLSRKPDPNALPPGAADALKEAESSIGNYLLKTDPDYVAPHNHNMQLRLCLCRQEIYENKRAFNSEVVELRKKKLHLVELTKKIGERLAEIRAEIPPHLAKPPPLIPAIDKELEFPEHNLEVKISEEEVKPDPVVLTMKVPGSVAKRNKSDERGSVLSIFPEPRIIPPKVPRFVPLSETKPLIASWELIKPRPDYVPTDIEIEIRERRINRHLYEQDVLLKDLEVVIQDFDSRLRQLQRERIRVQEKNQLLELHLYQMNQEMNVLNKFEAHEDRLAGRVNDKLMEIRGVQDEIAECEQRIEEHKAEKETLRFQCEELQNQFKKLVGDSKFADFLRRIFKKKYRPPRDRDDDEDTESESESSSSEEEEEGSLDSRDIGPIRLDPNICPEGCEIELYNKTFQMRDLRHRHEQEMLEKDRYVELLRRDIEGHNKVKRKMGLQLDKRKQVLKEFMMEKQNCLNEIVSTVVLNYDQIRARAISEAMGPEGLTNAVVFPETILKKLRKRVLELQEELFLAKSKAKINRTHLFRMNVDLRAMKRIGEEITAQIRDVLTRKLGKPRKVDKTFDDLLRQMARRHKYGSNIKIMPAMLAQFRSWKERHNEIEHKYLKALDKYSERIRVAAALQFAVLPQKPLKDPSVIHGGYDIEHYQRDVIRLRIVRSQQEMQIKQLQDEIHGFKLKTLVNPTTTGIPPPPHTLPAPDSEIWLYDIVTLQPSSIQKYFPISQKRAKAEVYDRNILNLLYNCLDAMRVTRDDAGSLLQDLTLALPDVISGQKSRFEVINELLRKWSLKHGGDPSKLKLKTKLFDAMTVLAERLIKKHIETLEGVTDSSHKVMSELEGALKDITEDKNTVADRLAPMIAALLHTAEIADIQIAETMTSLVNALIGDGEVPDNEELDEIDLGKVLADIKEHGVRIDDAEIMRVILLTMDCLRAQIVSGKEKSITEAQVEAYIRDAQISLGKHHQSARQSSTSSRSSKTGDASGKAETKRKPDYDSDLDSVKKQPTKTKPDEDQGTAPE